MLFPSFEASFEVSVGIFTKAVLMRGLAWALWSMLNTWHIEYQGHCSILLILLLCLAEAHQGAVIAGELLGQQHGGPGTKERLDVPCGDALFHSFRGLVLGWSFRFFLIGFVRR